MGLRVTFALALVGLAGCHWLLPHHPGERDGAPRGDQVLTDGPPVRDARDLALPDRSPGWRTIASLPAKGSCPAPWIFDAAIAGCRIPGPLACWEDNLVSILLPVPASYREIRGTIAGLQYHSTDGFNVASKTNPSLDAAYVEGVSITVGNPRQHVWTFASGLTRGPASGSCPCWGGANPPAFVGSSWTCDSGNATDYWEKKWYSALPLWDGDSVGPGCVPPAQPGSFQVTLPAPTTGPIEVRLMSDGCDENIGITSLTLEVR